MACSSEISPGARGVSAKRWLLPAPNVDAVRALSHALELPLAVASLLAARGLTDPEEARAFLQPSLEQLHPPLQMLGMLAAVQRLLQAAIDHELILIYGDYDVDGTTAVVLLKTAIERLGGVVRYHVPHRLREGYGMQQAVLERAATDGVRLVVSVDTGIRAFAAAEAAQSLGLDLIVTDHHLPDGALPQAIAVLNPNQPACGYPGKGLCGAGVAFKLSQALLEHAAGDDAEALARVRNKVLPSFLKMLAIATIADAVPLTGENRAIVALGLAALRDPVSPGLRALLHVAKLDPTAKPLSAMDVGFRLGPRINAAGRMDVASDVVELFTTRSHPRAEELATKLDSLNADRRAAEAAALQQVLEQAAAMPDARCLVLDEAGWHRGVIGILASRVVDATGKPVLVIAHEDGEAYGSGRSVAGFHLLDALESCASLFTRFGGHAHAAGFSLPSDRVPQLREHMIRYAAEHVSDEDLVPAVQCDAEVRLDQITPAVSRAVAMLEPFGMENPEPVFVTCNAELAAPIRTMKERHAKLHVTQGGARYAALAWNWAERLAMMGLAPGDPIDLAYRLRENDHPEWGGLELEVVDLRPSAPLPTGQSA